MMEVIFGRTRTVLLFKRFVVKIPSIKGWKDFLYGLIESMHEIKYRDKHNPYLIPILFFIRGGWIIVMPRAETVFKERDRQLLDYFKEIYILRSDPNNKDYLKARIYDNLECGTPENFGLYKGKVVCIDWGNPRNTGLNDFNIENWVPEINEIRRDLMSKYQKSKGFRIETQPSPPAGSFYPEIVDRYLGLLRTGASFGEGTESSDHLIWMLEHLRDNSFMSETKKHRWLGYVQGVMVVNGVVSVSEEREMTRGKFLGA